MGGWTGIGKDTIQWDGKIKALFAEIKELLDVENLKVDHIAEKTPLHRIWIDNNTEIDGLLNVKGTVISVGDGSGAVGSSQIVFNVAGSDGSLSFDDATNTFNFNANMDLDNGNFTTTGTGTFAGLTIKPGTNNVVLNFNSAGLRDGAITFDGSIAESFSLGNARLIIKRSLEIFHDANNYLETSFDGTNTTFKSNQLTPNGTFWNFRADHNVNLQMHGKDDASQSLMYSVDDGAGNPVKRWRLIMDGSGLDNRLRLVSFNDAGAGPKSIFTVTKDTGDIAFGYNVSAPKIRLTTIGGYAIKLTNETGAVSVAGETVKASVGTGDAVDATAGGELMCLGVFLDSGIAEHAEAWIVVSGIADVKADGTGWGLGDRIVTSATARRGAANNNPSTAVHFQEIGHAVEAAGANALGRCVLHFL